MQLGKLEEGLLLLGVVEEGHEEDGWEEGILLLGIDDDGTLLLGDEEEGTVEEGRYVGSGVGGTEG